MAFLLRGVVLAGGRATRLHPLTEVLNKHLLPVGREPMIWHCVRQLVRAGVQEILVTCSPEHVGDVARSLGSGSRFGCELTYRVQEGAKGIAHALAIAEAFAHGDRIVVLLGDNVFEHELSPHVGAFREQAAGARVLLKQVADPERYGVATLDGPRIVAIHEKPARPASDLAVAGCYMYDAQVWDIIRSIEPSARGEYEITAVNNAYVARGELAYGVIQGRWTDAGTFESLADANRILLENANQLRP